jgi:hypothetical protein
LEVDNGAVARFGLSHALGLKGIQISDLRSFRLKSFRKLSAHDGRNFAITDL